MCGGRRLLFLIGLFCSLDKSFSLQSLHNGGASKKNKVASTCHTSVHIDNASSNNNNNNGLLRRDEFFSRLVSAPAALLAAAALVATTTTYPQQAVAAEEEEEDQITVQDGITMYKTNSGLKYLELQPGTGASPRYGQLCAIEYTAYLKLPTESSPQKFDANSFLIKHGNGRIIAGLDEGLHTMKVGGKRRLIVPPKLGYVQSGLGPIPEMPWNRWRLNSLLSKMIDQRGGNLVFEVELKSVIDDEADQGYYEDGSPTPEEFQRLRLNFQERNSAAATAREAENDIV